MSKYIHNKSTAIVSLIEGKIIIPVGGKVQVTDQEAAHTDVTHSVRQGWVSVEGVKSTSAAPISVAGITIEKDKMQGSTTIPVIEKKVEAVSSPLGTVVSEAKPKKSKKAEVVV